METTMAINERLSIVVLPTLFAVIALLAVPVAAQEPLAAGSICTLPEAEREEFTEPFELCAVTRVAGNSATWVDVFLRKEVVVGTPFGASPDLQIEGDGAFVGFVLTGTEPGTSGLTLLGGRYPSPDSPAFIMPVPPYPGVGGGSFEFIKNYPNQVTVPPGGYRLYLLTDGKDVEVTLQLDELEGWIDLAPERPADYGLFFPESRPLGGAGVTNNMYSAGRSATLAGTGLLFQALWLDTDAHAAGQYVFCYRPPTEEDLDPIELGPGCPALSEKWEAANNRTLTSEPDEKLYMLALDQLEPGKHHFGFWSATEALVTDAQYAQVWLSYDDSAAAA